MISEAQLERLAILSEELGEVQQIIGKILRFEYINEYTDNRVDLAHEIFDIVVAIDLLFRSGDISKDQMEEHVSAKLKKLKLFTKHQEGLL